MNDTASIKNILVVRIRRVGDALLSTPLITSLKKTFPNAKIDFVLNEPINKLFIHNRQINELITIPRSIYTGSFFSYVRWVRKIMKNRRYDIIIDCRSTFNTLLFSLFSPKTKMRIGYKKKYNSIIHNERVVLNSHLNKVEELCSLLDPLTTHFPVEKDFSLSLEVSEDSKKAFRKRMESKGIDFGKPIILCNVASRDIKKQWDTDRMSEIMRHLLDYNISYQLIFNYAGEQERTVANSIYERLGRPMRIFIDIEAEDLEELATMISLCDFFFGNEGGARHIADALKVPSFSIFSPGISIDKWIYDRTDDNDGISPDDFNKTSDMNRTDEYNLIDVDSVWVKLKEKLDRYIMK